MQRQLQRIKGDGLVLVPPKSRAVVRQIKLGPGTLDRLTRHLEQQELQKEASGGRRMENDLIFPNSK